MSHAAPRVAGRFVLASLAAVGLAGCTGDASKGADVDRPDVIRPGPAAAATPTKSTGTAAPASDRVLAKLETVTVREGELVPLLYETYGLDALLKLLQRNLARAEAARLGLTVSPADIAKERVLTLRLAFPGQEEGDFDNLLKQLLSQQRVSRAEFDVVMDTNAHLRACVRGQAGGDVTADAIRNEYNMLYGERVRVRDIPVNNLQQVSEVQRALAEPGAKFEVVARRMGKIPALAQLGGQLPEFARTTPGYSQVFIDAAFAMQPGQVSTDAISEDGFFHILKVEERLAPKAVKFEDVQESVREQLIVRRTNNLMGALRQRFAQLALRELKIEEPAIRQSFEARRDAANAKPADRAEVQRSLEQQAATKPATDPAAAGPTPRVAEPTTTTTTQPAAR